jgi:hypothetical protein
LRVTVGSPSFWQKYEPPFDDGIYPGKQLHSEARVGPTFTNDSDLTEGVGIISIYRTSKKKALSTNAATILLSILCCS